jgi:hypothetical protein
VPISSHLIDPKAVVQPVQRPMLNFLVVGYTLTASDVTEFKEALARRDAWIEHYQERELELTDQVQAGRKFLDEVLKDLNAPIVGYGIQESKLIGMYHDRWVGTRLALTIQPKQPVTRLSVNGWVPDHMPAGGQLTIHAGDQTEVKDLVPGPFTLSVEMLKGTEAAIPIEVVATEWITPEGPGGRNLVFVLRAIELEHSH